MSSRVAEWQTDPVLFIREFLREDLWEKQAEIAEAVRDNERVAVASCHESGKTWLSARLAWWWALCFPGSRTVTTGPSDDHVKRVLWGEIRAAYATMRELWGDIGIPPPGIKQWEMEPKWDMVGFATKPDTAQQHAARFTGFHGPHVLVIFDEASGVDRLIWEAKDGLMTSQHVRFLAIGNPADPSGPFYDAFTSPRFKAITIDAYECPNVVARKPVLPWGADWPWVEGMQEDYGPDYEKDPVYQFKVRGAFPTTALLNLIGIADLDAAFGREPDRSVPNLPIGIGIDVAYHGDDLTTFEAVQGEEIVWSEGHANREPTWIAGRAIQIFEALGLRKEDAWRVAIDDTGGYGAGPSSILREQGWPITRINFASKPKDDRLAERYLNMRALMWWTLRDWIVETAALSGCDQRTKRLLRYELPAVRQDVTSMGKRKLEPKDKLKDRIGKSPDYGDALALALSWTLRGVVFDMGAMVRASQPLPPTGHPDDDPDEGRPRSPFHRDGFGGVTPGGNPYG